MIIPPFQGCASQGDRFVGRLPHAIESRPVGAFKQFVGEIAVSIRVGLRKFTRC